MSVANTISPTNILLNMLTPERCHQICQTVFVSTGVKVINQKHTIFHNYILYILSTFMYSHLNIHRV